MKVVVEKEMRRSTMEILCQDGTSCSTTCLAMITGNTPEYIQSLVGGQLAINWLDQQSVCKKIGLKLKKKKDWYGPLYPDNPLPPTCLIQAECRMSGTYHLMCRIGNMFYDTNRPNSFHTFDFNEYSIANYVEWETETVWTECVFEGRKVKQGDTAWYVNEIGMLV